MIVPDSHLLHALSQSQWSEDLLDVHQMSLTDGEGETAQDVVLTDQLSKVGIA